MALSPIIAVHLFCASAALVLGPVVMWARLGTLIRPKAHRLLGKTWVALMLMTSATALFIRDFRLPNIAGYTLIHLLVPVTLVSLGMAFFYLHRKDFRRHKIWMISLYLSACVGAGGAAFLPGRFLHTQLTTLLGA
jgi:uncharacterized membrane protein